MKRIIIISCLFGLLLCSCAKAETSGTSDAHEASETAQTIAVQETEPAAKPAPEKISNPYSVKNGILSYDDGEYTSEFGIDVSSYSGDIDWSAVKESGVTFAVVRLGGRGYGGSGALYTDSKALENIAGALENGIKAGGYFFSQAVSADEAAEEAEYALEIIDGKNITLPVFYDFEHIDGDSARTDDITPDEASAFAEAFCGRIEKSGLEAAVYSDKAKNNYSLEKLDRTLWVADFDNRIERADSVLMFQYSKDGSLDGISVAVDLDIMFVKKG